jgi:hypothetical protein
MIDESFARASVVSGKLFAIGPKQLYVENCRSWWLINAWNYQTFSLSTRRRVRWGGPRPKPPLSGKREFNAAAKHLHIVDLKSLRLGWTNY